MDTQTLILLIGAIVVVLILRAISTKKVGPSNLETFQSNSNAIPKTPITDISLATEEEAKELIRKGQKIDAIKLIRGKNNMDLSEAKDYADLLELEIES